MRSFVIALMLSVTFALPSLSFAASLSKVKGKRALINLDGESVREGEQFFALDSAGKRKALVRVDKVRGDKALGTVVKGRAETGWLLSKRVGQGGAAVVAKKDAESASSQITASDTRWGVVLGYASQSATVTLDNPNKDIAHAGSSFYLGGLIDAPITGRFSFRGLLGYQPFNVTSGETHPLCKGSGNNCNIAINYFSADLWGRFHLTSGNLPIWMGGGVGLLFAASDASTTIQSNTTAQTMMVGFGTDVILKSSWTIPIQLEYSGFANSDTVLATSINLKAGVSVKF